MDKNKYLHVPHRGGEFVSRDSIQSRQPEQMLNGNEDAIINKSRESIQSRQESNVNQPGINAEQAAGANAQREPGVNTEQQPGVNAEQVAQDEAAEVDLERGLPEEEVTRDESSIFTDPPSVRAKGPMTEYCDGFENTLGSIGRIKAPPKNRPPVRVIFSPGTVTSRGRREHITLDMELSDEESETTRRDKTTKGQPVKSSQKRKSVQPAKGWWTSWWVWYATKVQRKPAETTPCRKSPRLH